MLSFVSPREGIDSPAAVSLLSCAVVARLHVVCIVPFLFELWRDLHPPAVHAEGVTVTLGRWYHVVGTYDGAVARLFVDGALAAAVEVDNVIEGVVLGCYQLLRSRHSFYE